MIDDKETKMKIRKITQALTHAALAAGIILLAAVPAMAQSQTAVRSGNIQGESSGVARIPGGTGGFGANPASGFGSATVRTPGGTPLLSLTNDNSFIDNYLHQDEQVNLDANTGNIRVLRTNQKALLNDFVTKVYPLNNVDPREIREPLNTIIGLEGGRADVIRDDEGGQHYLQVVCPEFMIPHLDKAIPALDEKWVREYDSGSADAYYRPKFRLAAEVNTIAANYASEQGFSVLDLAANAAVRIDEPFRIRRYAQAAEIVDIPGNQVELEISIYEISAQNDLKIGLDYIAWKNGPGRGLVQFIYQGLDAQSTNDPITSVFDPFGGLGTISDVDGSPFDPTSEFKQLIDLDQRYRSVNYLLTSNYIDFLQVRGEARVVKRQRMTVVSSQTASFSADESIVALVASGVGGGSQTNNSGSQLTVLDRSALSGINAQRFRRQSDFQGNSFLTPIGSPSSSVVDTDRRLHKNAGRIGIFVEVTPFVGLESMELVLAVEAADLNGIAPNGQPIINTRTLTTTVRLFDGEPLVVGGLKRRNDTRESAKAPVLGDLPIVGYLFGGEQTVKRWNDVVIVVKPSFYLTDQTSLHLSAHDSDLALNAEGGNGSPVIIPKNSYFFDQWLLDPDKTL